MIHIEAYEALQSENRELRGQVAQLAHELSQLKRLVFGTKSERFVPAGSPDQLPLFEGAPPQPPLSQTQVVARRRRKKPVRQPLPSHLPREVIVIEPEQDTTGLRKIGEEISETLDYRPAKLIVLRRVRPKYVDPKDEDRGVIIGELPPRPVEKGMAEPALLAHVLVEKYVDHLPLYRQVQRFSREGITLSDSTLGDWISATADLLVPLYEALTAEALASGYIPRRRSRCKTPRRQARRIAATTGSTMHRARVWW